MFIYHVSRMGYGYDNYSDFVCVDANENDARMRRPDDRTWEEASEYDSWPNNPNHVSVKLIGVAEDNIRTGIIISSYHAG